MASVDVLRTNIYYKFYVQICNFPEISGGASAPSAPLVTPLIRSIYFPYTRSIAEKNWVCAMVFYRIVIVNGLCSIDRLKQSYSKVTVTPGIINGDRLTSVRAAIRDFFNGLNPFLRLLLLWNHSQLVLQYGFKCDIA